jgi:tetratricopeptide (TPR) repeat protein
MTRDRAAMNGSNPASPIASLRRTTGETHRALGDLDRGLGETPADPELWVLQSLALMKAGRYVEAAGAWQKAVNLHSRPDDSAQLLARLAREQRDEELEIWALGTALPYCMEPQWLLARLFALQMRRNDCTAALATADLLVALKPDYEPYLLRRAACLIGMGHTGDAEMVLDGLVGQSPVSDAAINSWAHLLLERVGRADELIERLAPLAAKPNATWTVHWWMGKALAHVERSNEAVASFKRAIEIAPSAAKPWHDLAILQRHLGLAIESQSSFFKSLELEPNNPTALRLAGYEHTYVYGDAAFRRVTLALAHVHRVSKPSQVEVYYAAAKALEDVGELDAAFAHYARAGRLQKQLTPWSVRPTHRLLAMLKREFTHALHADLRSRGYASRKPVFIIGMPRSGTSLVEQIIASHPQARGAGELRAADGVIDGLKIGGTTILADRDSARVDAAGAKEALTLYERGRRYLETIETIAGPDAIRIVDKRPGNFTWTGLLDAAIPGSFFIHCRRHPVETCLSAYRLFFGGEVPFSYDLRDLGQAFRLYHEVMTYWSSLLPADRILHLRQEDLVDDFEGQVRRILDFIGLPWNDACLAFFDNDRIVRTASSIQVRRPIYGRPIDSWRKYEPYLGPLLQELGDLVPQYEGEVRSRQHTA